ncbi:MAG: 50S ribosomal protein L6 [Pseudomonadota bacterium]
MSRIGKLPVPVLEGVKVDFDAKSITIEGPKGKLSQDIHKLVSLEVVDNNIIVKRIDDTTQSSAIQGLTRSLIFNMIKGVTEEYKRELRIVGVGYKADLSGNDLTLNVGLSHQVIYPLPDGISVQLEDKNTRVIISGCDKALVGEVAAELRSYRPPEPYKGKGVRYDDEVIRKKVGKAGSA